MSRYASAPRGEEARRNLPGFKVVGTHGSGRREFLESLAAVAFITDSGRQGGRNAAGDRQPQPTDYLFSDGLIYLGTATMGPCSRATVEATMRAWYQLETNPTYMGYTGDTLQAAERVRDQAAQLLGCTRDEILITRSTTDGVNAVAQGLRLAPGQRVIITDQEHPGGRSAWEYYAGRGVGLDVMPIPPGENDTAAILDRLAHTITPATRVISVSHVLSSTGFRMPIAEIATLARSRGVVLVVDGAQAAGTIPVDVKALGCHAYATSGHKWLMAPKGTGLLYLSNDPGAGIEPMQCQDGRAFYSHSSGVGNLPGVVGLGVALESLRVTGIAEVERHNMAVRNRLYDGLRSLANARVVSAPPGPLATPLVTFRIPDRIDSAELGRRLREQQIQVKVVPKEWLNGIRLSPHIFNTEQEADRVLAVLRRELA